MSDDIKSKRTRSPAYPAINLEEALSKASVLWKKINRHPAPVETVNTLWGYDKNSSTGYSMSAALIKYGLLEDDGIGDNRTIKLTETAIQLTYNPDVNSAEYKQTLKQAALMPKIHSELWKRYEGNLPDDSVIKRHLVVERKFNELYVDSFIKQFKQTISFAGLAPSDIVETEQIIETSPMIARVADTPQAPANLDMSLKYFKALQQHQQQTVEQESDLSLPLESGKVIRIPKMTEDDYQLFLETVQLWKRRIVIKPEQKSEERPE